MTFRKLLNTVVLPAVACVMHLQAAGPVIGLAVTDGRLAVDKTMVTGNASLQEGSLVRTANTPTRIQLANGIRATLGAETQARVHADRLELARGATLVATPGYRVVAGQFAIQASDGAQSQVYRNGASVEIGAAHGPVMVRNAEGMVLARVMPGRPVRLEPGEPGMSSMSGVLRKQDGEFRLRDEITNLDVTVTGSGLEPEVGHRVTVAGRARAAGDSQVIEIASLNRVPTTEAKDEAATPQQGGSPDTTSPGGAGPGSYSGGATVGLLGAAAGVGLAVGVFAAHGPGDMPISR